MLKKSYFFVLLITVFSKNVFAMEAILGKVVPESELKNLREWNEKAVKRGALVAYKSGQRFYYAALHEKLIDNSYTVIILQKTDERGVQSAHGRKAEREDLRIVAQEK